VAARSSWPPERRLGTAVVASLAVHAAAMSLSLPAPRVSLFEPLAVLQVSVSEFAVRPAAPPEPASLAPPPPPPAKRIKPEPRKHEPVPLARTSEPHAQSPAAIVQEERARASAPEGDVALRAAPPQPALPPLAAQVPAPWVPSPELLSSYGQAISQVLARYKEYPRIAQMRGWEGAVTMRLRVAPSGRLIEAKVQTSSGHEVLDQQALEMAVRAGRLPAPPDGLHDREEVAVLVPIVFRLEP
jgi:protein TonB